MRDHLHTNPCGRQPGHCVNSRSRSIATPAPGAAESGRPPRADTPAVPPNSPRMRRRIAILHGATVPVQVRAMMAGWARMQAPIVSCGRVRLAPMVAGHPVGASSDARRRDGPIGRDTRPRSVRNLPNAILWCIVMQLSPVGRVVGAVIYRPLWMIIWGGTGAVRAVVRGSRGETWVTFVSGARNSAVTCDDVPSRRSPICLSLRCGHFRFRRFHGIEDRLLGRIPGMSPACAGSVKHMFPARVGSPVGEKHVFLEGLPSHVTTCRRARGHRATIAR